MVKRRPSSKKRSPVIHRRPPLIHCWPPVVWVVSWWPVVIILMWEALVVVMNSEWLPAISWEIASPPVIVTSLPLPIGWSLLWGVKRRPSMIWLRDCSTPSLLIIHLFLISRAVSIFTALFSSSLFLSWAVKLLLLLTWTVCLGLSGHLLLFSGFGQLLGRIVNLSTITVLT